MDFKSFITQEMQKSKDHKDPEFWNAQGKTLEGYIDKLDAKISEDTITIKTYRDKVARLEQRERTLGEAAGDNTGLMADISRLKVENIRLSRDLSSSKECSKSLEGRLKFLAQEIAYYKGQCRRIEVEYDVTIPDFKVCI